MRKGRGTKGGTGDVNPAANDRDDKKNFRFLTSDPKL